MQKFTYTLIDIDDYANCIAINAKLKYRYINTLKHKHMTYPSYFPNKYRYKPPNVKPRQQEHKQKPDHRHKLTHFRKNKQHYQFIALSIILGLLSALTVTLALTTK